MGGKNSACNGTEYDYSKNATHINEYGQFALNNLKHHTEISNRIVEFLKSDNIIH